MAGRWLGRLCRGSVDRDSWIRLLVVEDHPIYRDGISAAFSEVEDVVVVGAVGTIREAREALAGGAVDVMLLDLGLTTATVWTCCVASIVAGLPDRTHDE